MPKNKEEVISFKVDPALASTLKRLPNRSHFIRRAILRALDQACPLCQGSGTLTPDQHSHWSEFAKQHRVTECATCGSLHLVCASGRKTAGSSL